MKDVIHEKEFGDDKIGKYDENLCLLDICDSINEPFIPALIIRTTRET